MMLDALISQVRAIRNYASGHGLSTGELTELWSVMAAASDGIEAVIDRREQVIRRGTRKPDGDAA